MLTYDVMFSAKAGHQMTLQRTKGHDAVHAALSAWRKSGLNIRPRIIAGAIGGEPIPRHFEFHFDGVAVYVSRVDDGAFLPAALLAK